MKTHLIISVALAASAAFSSCTKDESVQPANPTSQTGTGNQDMSSGSWRVSHYEEDQKVQTTLFKGYDFRFKQGGELTATNNVATISGRWWIDGDNKLNMNFSQSPFSELNEDWDIVAQTSAVLSLRHTSGGDGSTDLLTFEKNQ